MKCRHYLSFQLFAVATFASFLGCNQSGLVSPDLIGINPADKSGSQPTADPQVPVPTDVSSLYVGPEELSKYVAKFVDDAKLQGVDVTPEMTGPILQIQIASLDSYGASVIGLCESSSNIRRVTFDPDFWDTASETQRELLAHHELGHCVLYRPHRSTLLPSGAYASLMYPIIMKSSTYTSNYDYYQNELFHFSAAEAPLGNEDPTQPVVHVCDGGVEP